MAVTDAIEGLSVPQILVAEDNPGDVRLLEEGVAAVDADVELHICNDGNRAIERLTADETVADHLDLVLLDLNLPGRSGFEILHRVRTESRLDNVPVVVVSSSENPDDVQRVYEGAANAYVSKPADPDEYIRTVAAVVQFWIPEVNETDD